VVLIYKGGDRSVVGNNKPVSLTSVACILMERVIAGYLRQVWEMCGWLYDGQHGFRPGYSCDCQLVTVCQDIADSLDEGVRTDAIIIDFSKDFDLVPHGRMLKKIAATGVDEGSCMGKGISLRMFAVDGQLSEKVRVPQRSVLGLLLFLAYVNDIWRNTESNIRLFANNCIIYRNIMDSSDIDKLQPDLNTSGKWALKIT